MTHASQRHEFTRSFNRILARHDVNLGRVTVSSSGPVVCLSGRLERHPSGNFSAQEIHALVKNLEAMPYRLRLRFNLSNWNMEKGNGGWVVTPLGVQTAEDSDDEDEDFDYSRHASARTPAVFSRG